jgi:hypothetical protein
MGEYYVPPNKRELLEFIRKRYFAIGQTVAGLERLPKKQLYAIFYRMRQEIQSRELADQS